MSSDTFGDVDRIPIVDAHHHFWDLDSNHVPWLSNNPPVIFRYGSSAPLRKNFLPADLVREARNQRLIGSVYVEAEWDPRGFIDETEWVHALATRTSMPSAVVAQAWLDRDDCDELLHLQSGFPLVRGVRHKPFSVSYGEPVRFGRPGSMTDKKWQRGYALLEKYGLHFELQVPCWHLTEATALASSFPNTLLILNHTGLPADRTPGGLNIWRRGMEALAALPNTAVKISGLGQISRRWSEEANRELVLETIEIFSAERCMFASNFPVDRIVGSYDAIYNGFRNIVSALSTENQELLFFRNALKFYRLPRLL